MILIRIGTAQPARFAPEGGVIVDIPLRDYDRNALQPDSILRDEATGQCYVLNHQEDLSPLWELKPIG